MGEGDRGRGRGKREEGCPGAYKHDAEERFSHEVLKRRDRAGFVHKL